MFIIRNLLVKKGPSTTNFIVSLQQMHDYF